MKMTEERINELLAKIERVSCNDQTVTADVESSIKLWRNDDGNIVVDLFAH